MDRWSAMGWGELIDVGAWRGLADWVGRDGHRAAVPALARLLESELPAEPPLRELVKIRENLGWLDADALDVHGRVAFDTLVHFLDQAIEHGQACEGDPDRDSTVRFQWSHLKP